MLDHILARRTGKIVNIGSVNGAYGGFGTAVYSACKAGALFLLVPLLVK